MPRRVLVVVNPISGLGKSLRAAERFALAYRAAGGVAEIHPTRSAGDGGRRAAGAAGEGFQAVVAVGGDGTVNEVVNGMRGAGAGSAALPVGIVPMGTANVLARELRVHLDPEEAAAVVATGRERAVDLGEARNGAGETRRFLACAGAGFDAAVVKAVAEGRRGGLGFRGWAGPIWRTFRAYDFPPVRVAADGGAAIPATIAIVCNTANYGGLLSLVPTADPGDGAFDACLIDARRRRSLFRYAFAAWRGTLARQGDVKTLRGRTILIEADRPVPAQVDGDPFGSTPLRITVHPGAARILVRAKEGA